MCGITGFIDLKRQTSDEGLAAQARRMADSMLHRGPDDSGTWTDATSGIAFGFRRLSIIDLSPAGHQPMVSANGPARHLLQRRGLQRRRHPPRARPLAPNWRGHSDTEVMLEAFAAWGVERGASKSSSACSPSRFGRRETRRLWLVRDRLGIKPLYWAADGSTLHVRLGAAGAACASGVRGRDRPRMPSALFMRHNYYPNPRTVFSGVHQLPPGHML